MVFCNLHCIKNDNIQENCNNPPWKCFLSKIFAPAHTSVKCSVEWAQLSSLHRSDTFITRVIAECNVQSGLETLRRLYFVTCH